jgi:hypothetical protein
MDPFHKRMSVTPQCLQPPFAETAATNEVLFGWRTIPHLLTIARRTVFNMCCFCYGRVRGLLPSMQSGTQFMFTHQSSTALRSCLQQLLLAPRIDVYLRDCRVTLPFRTCVQAAWLLTRGAITPRARTHTHSEVLHTHAHTHTHTQNLCPDCVAFHKKSNRTKDHMLVLIESRSLPAYSSNACLCVCVCVFVCLCVCVFVCFCVCVYLYTTQQQRLEQCSPFLLLVLSFPTHTRNAAAMQMQSDVDHCQAHPSRNTFRYSNVFLSCSMFMVHIVPSFPAHKLRLVLTHDTRDTA